MRFKPATRISLGLVLLTVGVLLVGDMIGLTPDGSQAALQGRQRFCESIAVQLTLAMQNNDQSMIDTLIHSMVERNPDIVSAGLRQSDGRYLVQSGQHVARWQPVQDDASTPTQVQVPIFRGALRWGTLEMHFLPLRDNSFRGLLAQPFARLVMFMAVVGFVVYLVLLKKSLKYLDPSSVIPGRVKAALDILAEGVALVDENGSIVLANRSFAAKCGLDMEQLMGKPLMDLPWRQPSSGRSIEHFPWLNAMREGKSCIGVPMQLQGRDGLARTLMVNGSPILDGKGLCRGALATFDDVTQLEMKNSQLEEMLSMLKDSQDKVHEQNDQLRILASEDALTKCLNRRALFENIEIEFDRARQRGTTLCCIMCDIDNFKNINDRFGHGTGDRVIEEVAKALRAMTRDNDSIGRYGGEEFCILLPKLTLAQAAETAERLRSRIEAINIDGIQVTASFGLTCSDFGAVDIRELLHQADTALYAAKDGGRNAVAVWDTQTTLAHGTHRG